MGADPQPGYRYNVEDRSILLPYYKRFVWEPLLALVPARITPNTLSIWGNVGSTLSFVVLLFANPSERWAFAVAAAGTFAYLCLDNMDGTHARRTGQSSPLGEFLDHWFDSFNTGFLTLGLYYAARLPPEQILAVVAATNVAYFATMWEQRHTSFIRFGRGGQIEGVSVIVLVYVAIALLGHEAICRTPLFGLLSVVELTAVLLVFAYVLTVIGSAARTGRAFGEWAPLLLVMALVGAWYAVGRLGFFPAAALLLLSNAALGGRHVIARVLERPYSSLDLGLIAGLLVGFGSSLVLDLSERVQGLMGWGVAAYVVGRLAFDFISTVHSLRRFLRPGELLERALLMRRPSRHV